MLYKDCEHAPWLITTVADPFIRTSRPVHQTPQITRERVKEGPKEPVEVIEIDSDDSVRDSFFINIADLLLSGRWCKD